MTRSKSAILAEQLHNLTTTVVNLNELAVHAEPHSSFADWIEHLKAAEAGLRAARYQLESLQAGRRCTQCNGAMVGRSDRAYCSSACRVANHRGKPSTNPDSFGYRQRQERGELPSS